METSLLFFLSMIISIAFYLPLVSSSVTISVLSYNIRSGSNISDVYNITRTGETIKSLSPMLVGVQEVDNMTARHPGDDQPAILGSITGLTPVYGKMRDFEGGGYGILVLSAFPVLDTRIYHYSPPGGQPTNPANCSVATTNDYCQGAVAIRVQPPGASSSFWFATTHLGLGGGQYNESLQLASFLFSLDGPVIVTGDFNSVPTDPTIVYMQSKFQDAWVACGSGNGYTFNSSDPYERIDFQFNYPPGEFFKCGAASVPDTENSDHRPVLIDYTLA